MPAAGFPDKKNEMARFKRASVIQKMYEQGMVPLFYHPEIEIGKKVLAACYSGGARLLEFTNRGDFAQEVFAELNKFAARELPEMMIGVGSLQDAGTASLYIQLGAAFVVTPCLREDIAFTCNRRKILWASGCGSLTEIGHAEELGAEIVKLFPGSTYGPDFVKSILGPQPWTSIMPTGGVTPEKENLQAWFKSGVSCVGMGSQLISKDVIENKDWEGLENKVRKTLQLIQKLKK